MRERNYWVFRIDTRAIDYLDTELNEGRLRQGWGWDKRQNLTCMTIDEGAGRNRVIMERVKKDDILLIPRLPDWNYVTIAEATADWDQEYRFEIDKDQSDYGHIFPAKRIRSFVRSSSVVDSCIRKTLRVPSRFWNINHCSQAIAKILDAKQEETQIEGFYENRMERTLSRSFLKNFDEKQFGEEVYEQMSNQFEGFEWEYALVYGLERLFPCYEIERVGGRAEKEHGTDILVKLPGILPESRYAIAIQVKDYEGFVRDSVIEQINKADSFWSDEGLTVIDKIVIITKAPKDSNLHLLENTDGIRFFFAADLKNLLLSIGKSFIGIQDSKTK